MYGVRIPYQSADLQKLVPHVAQLGRCPFCDELLSVATLSFDHATPLARGGGFTLENLLPCCLSCNTAKGVLTADEFRALWLWLKQLPHYPQHNTLARLKLGAARLYGGKRRSNYRRRRRFK